MKYFQHYISGGPPNIDFVVTRLSYKDFQRFISNMNGSLQIYKTIELIYFIPGYNRSTILDHFPFHMSSFNIKNEIEYNEYKFMNSCLKGKSPMFNHELEKTWDEFNNSRIIKDIIE